MPKPVEPSAQNDTENLSPTVAPILLQEALDQLEEGVIVTDAGAADRGPIICYANRAFSRMTGYPREELIGKSPRLLHGPKTDKTVTTQLKEHYEAGECTRGESVNYRKDGSEFVMQWQVSPVASPDGGIAHYVGVHKDVSRIRRLEEDLLQAQKMDAIGRLAGGIAHDFNNLLAVILSFSELLLETPNIPDSSTSFAREIHKAARRAAELTSELMAFSRRENADPELLDLKDILSQMTRIIRRILPENIEVEATCPNEPLYVRINRAALEQALVHLTTNARDALPEGGRIEVGLNSLNESESETVLPEMSAPRAFAVITFSDNGKGMSEAVSRRAFDPFFTTKPIGKGTGLGLSTTYTAVKNAGGHIEIESREGEGTRVTLYLPIETLVSETIEEKEAVSPRLSVNQIPILVVEDDESMRDCIIGVLSISNYEVFAAASAEEALEAFEDRAEKFSLLLTDLVLPGMSGAGLADRFMKKNPAIRILYMTGYHDDSHGLGDLPGKAALLRKPFSLNQVLESVQETLRD